MELSHEASRKVVGVCLSVVHLYPFVELQILRLGGTVGQQVELLLLFFFFFFLA